MNSDLWVGAVTTLAGAVLGGAISLSLNRQQANDARLQRLEEDSRERYKRSVDRRFSAYADFLTQARSYRDAIRPYEPKRSPSVALNEIDILARSADAASALVFLVLESTTTYESCRAILNSLGRSQAIIHSEDSLTTEVALRAINDEMSRLLREFQVATREELGISGVDASLILPRRQHVAPLEDGPNLV